MGRRTVREAVAEPTDPAQRLAQHVRILIMRLAAEAGRDTRAGRLLRLVRSSQDDDERAIWATIQDLGDQTGPYDPATERFLS